MTSRMIRLLTSAALAVGAAACSQGSPYGSVLGMPAPSDQVYATVRGVDMRSQQLMVQTSDGQRLNVLYDNRTEVVYGNQRYPATALSRGDQVLLRLESMRNGGYYADAVQVTSSGSGSNGGYGDNGRYGRGERGRGRNDHGGYGQRGQYGAATVLTGTVRQIDARAGWFTMDTQGGGTVTVTMPARPQEQDVRQLRLLRPGSHAEVEGVFVTGQQLELRRFR